MIFRVEIRKDGSVASCTEVELSLQNSKHVFYVEAKDRSDAVSRAKARFDSLNRSRNRAKDSGLCISCMREPRVTANHCRPCADKQVLRARERRGLEHLPEPERLAAHAARIEAKRANASEQLAKAREHSSESVRSASDARWDSSDFIPNRMMVGVLRQCLRAFDRNPSGFRAWLMALLARETTDSTAAE